jgi:hypothetical protein
MRHYVLATAALATAGTLAAPTPALAWGGDGHRTVCAIAYRHLTPAAKAAVDSLIPGDGTGRSFAESCTWADSPGKFGRGGEHFANYPRTLRRVTSHNCPGTSKCVLSAIDADAAILGSDAPSDDQLKALKFLGHWVGDIHQPLHISYQDDIGGNDLKASGTCRRADNLHSVWDGCVIQQRILDPSIHDFVAADLAAAERIDSSVTAMPAAALRRWRQSSPWQWAAESYAITTRARTGYCIRKQAACWYSASSQTFDKANPRTEAVDDAYLDWAKPIVEQRLAQGGIRLADRLNRRLDPHYDPATGEDR